MAGTVQAIDKSTVHRICSGQVILDLATAVKELVENALDAGASNIEVRLKDYGAETIEVADNGSGIAPADYHALTRKHHTSKISQFTDLQALGTFGFRGEALSSLCAMSDLGVVTRRADQAAATKLEFSIQGELKATSAAARSVGTTVSVKNIFKPLPVRYKEFKRNLKKEFARLVTVLQAYALISTGVRLICTNQAAGSARTTVISTQGAASMRDNIITVFGARTIEGLQALDAPAADGTRLEGYVSKGSAGLSRATGDRQFVFLNGRPIDFPKMNKLINESFRSLTSPALAHHKPMVVLNLLAPKHSYDVNVTPDKRKVFFEEERSLLDAVQEALNGIWEPTRSKFKVGSGSQQPSQRQRRAIPDSAEGEADDAESETTSDEEDDESTEAGTGTSRHGAGDAQQTPDPPIKDRLSKRLAFSALRDSEPRSHGRSPLGQPERASAASDSTPRRSAFTPGGGDASRRRVSQPLISRFVTATTPAATPIARGDANASAQGHGTHESAEDQSDREQDTRRQEALPPRPVRRTKEDEQEIYAAPEQAPSAAPGEAPPPVVMAPREAEASPSGSDTTHEQDDMRADPAPGGSAEEPVDALDGGAIGNEQADVLHTAKKQRIGDTKLQSSGEGEPACDEVMNVPDSHPPAVEQAPARGAPHGAAAICDLDGLERRWVEAKRRRTERETRRDMEQSSFKAASLQGAKSDELGLHEATASAELERIFDKASFRKLRILGQFNLGFILARLGDDLFIIDQHASDEKFNFERLTRTTQLNRQPLLAPQKLDLTPAEVITVRDCKPVFEQNGFEIRDADDGSLVLTGVPFSKSMTFGRADVQELAQILSGDGSPHPGTVVSERRGAVNTRGRLPRPSRVRAMLAMRACRSSIMIGKTLDRPTMERVVGNLADLDAPWNCPHGRPTMRHLAVLPGKEST